MKKQSILRNLLNVTLLILGIQFGGMAQVPFIKISNISEYQVFQRNSSDEADMLISGSYTGSATAIEASFNGGTYEIIDSSPSGGSFSGTLSSQSTGQGTLIVRYTNDINKVASLNNIGVGDIFVIAGQSNASRRGNTLNAYTHSTLKASIFGNNDVWQELKDATDNSSGQIDAVSRDNIAAGSPWPLIATSILENSGVPIAFLPAAKGGTNITQWQPGANHSNPSTLYGSMNRRINAVGGAVAGVLFFQGESDAFYPENTLTIYKAGLTTIVDAIAADFPGTKVMIGQIGHSDRVGLDNIRGGQVETANTNVNALLGPATYDINLADEGGDALHFKSNADMEAFATRWYKTIDKEFYGGTDGYGPILDAASLVYDEGNNKIIVPFNDDSSPVLDPSSTVTTSSFELKNNGTSVAISTIAIVGNTVEIIPAATLNTAQSITLSYASLNTAIDAAIYDSQNLPAQPFYDINIGLLNNENYTINDLNIYPNPAQEVINLVFNKIENSEMDITIYDISGQTVIEMKKEIQINTAIDISSLNKGIYFLKIKTDLSEMVKKVIIE